MSVTLIVRAAKVHVKEFAGPVIAAGLLYAGFKDIISSASYPLAGLILRAFNAIIRRGFPDRIVLANPYEGVPLWVHTRAISDGLIGVALGTLVGLWVYSASMKEKRG